MALPILKSQGFVRTPDKYPHDAFGADTGGRVRPHSGLDTTPTVNGATACAVVAGRVTRTGNSFYAGNYVEVLGSDGWLWLSIHLHSIAVAPGQQVAAGQGIGIVGNTGGAGAINGKSTLAVHSHVSRCRDTTAANRILNGLIRARFKGETTAQWADAMGLSDPWPTIRDSDKNNTPAKPTPAPAPKPTPDQEDDMLIMFSNKRPNGALVYPNGQVDVIIDGDTRASLAKSGGLREAKVLDDFLESRIARGSK